MKRDREAEGKERENAVKLFRSFLFTYLYFLHKNTCDHWNISDFFIDGIVAFFKHFSRLFSFGLADIKFSASFLFHHSIHLLPIYGSEQILPKRKRLPLLVYLSRFGYFTPFSFLLFIYAKINFGLKETREDYL
jgi:hypothetical protein